MPTKSRLKTISLILVIPALALAGFAGFTALSPKTQDRLYTAAMNLEIGLSDMNRRSAHVGDHTMVYLQREAVGEKAGTIVLLHGFTADKSNWLRMVRQLPKNYEVIAPDWPAHGESAYIEGADYGIEAQADRLQRFMAQRSLSSAHIVGHSMGGAIAANFASRYPESLSSLTLMNAGGVDDPNTLSDLERSLQTTGENPLLVKKPGDMNNTLKFAMSKPPFIPWPLTQVLERTSIERAPRFAAVFEQITDGVTSTDTAYLTQISAPTLILWGDQDRLLSVENAAVFEQAIPDSQLVVYPGIGHMPMLEVPKLSGQDVARFVSKVDAAKPAT